MKVTEAIRISISIPFLFKPVRYENKLFVDGALYDNYPILHALKKYFPSDIVGCLINIRFKEEDSIENIDTFIKVCIRSISVKLNQFTINAYRDCSIIINCEKAFYDFTCLDEVENFINLGYQSAKEHFQSRFPNQEIIINSISDKDILL